MDTIYQASDLATNRRREFLNEAKRGGALLRDTDGSSLVMMPAGAIEVLRALRAWLVRDIMLEAALAQPWEERRPVDLGDLAWLSVFDDDDQREFQRELHEALLLAASSDSIDPVERCVTDWRTTARALSDNLRRILTGVPGDDEFVPVERPA